MSQVDPTPWRDLSHPSDLPPGNPSNTASSFFPDAVIERARVVRALDGGLDLEVERRSTCGGCAARSGCGTGLLSEWLGRKPTWLRVHSRLRAQPGDAAIVALEQGGLVKGALAVYLVPLIGLLLPPLLLRGWFPGAGEAVEIALALIGLVLSMLLVRRWAGRHAPVPILVEIIPAAASGERGGASPVALRRTEPDRHQE